MAETSSQPKGRNLLQFVLTVVLIVLATQIGIRLLFPETFQERQEVDATIVVRAESPRLNIGNNVRLIVTNRTEGDFTIPDRCPLPPVEVRREGEEGSLDPGEGVLPCTPLDPIPAGGKEIIDVSSWKYTLFHEPGTYEISLAGDIAGVPAAKLRIRTPGFFTALFRAVVLKPLYNVLLLLGAILPGHSLALSIILLTILVKAILFFPSQHALEGQKKLQALQPKIEELKRRYADDQKKMSEETMQLWRENRINPFQSCLPTFIQIPILIGLFFVVKDGTVIALNQHLLYGWFQADSWQFATTFLGALDLTVPNWTYVPLMLAGLQFWQMKLSFASSGGRGRTSLPEAKPQQAVGRRGLASPPEVRPQEGVSSKSFLEKLDQKTMMQYLLPLMVGFFAMSLPAAVSLYWGTSTVFAVGQQALVNRKQR